MIRTGEGRPALHSGEKRVVICKPVNLTVHGADSFLDRIRNFLRENMSEIPHRIFPFYIRTDGAKSITDPVGAKISKTLDRNFSLSFLPCFPFQITLE